jgi:hypothetical protein
MIGVMENWNDGRKLLGETPAFHYSNTIVSSYNRTVNS